MLYLDRDKMQARGLSPTDVMGALVNRRTTVAAAAVVAALISGLNVFLLVQTFGLA